MSGRVNPGDGDDSGSPGWWISPSISSSFVGKFLTSENKIKIGALTSAVSGGSLYALLFGPVSITLAFGRAWKVLSSIPANIIVWAETFVGSFGDLGDTVWDPWTIDLGFFALPANVLVILVLFTVVAWGVNTWRKA